ncbi:SHOCT domain-containing protein [Candidatus Solirubrobacter pratensis]|uniref:SHOCT domain-containing protein n=1 Tax=Candidatus Solirubrobacter pratensis TaxID=1298857 RepID=UPI0003FCE349|nr:SHOCT domain-containing protein [Candidatus Solirubrobacter pratensis]
MLLAADYPFLDVLWTMIIFFTWVIWIWMIVIIFTDVFRRRDIGGWAKAAWCVLMIVLPFIGVLAYLIAQHDGIAERNLERAQVSQRQFDDHVRAVAVDNGGGAGAATEIAKAQELLEKGAIDRSEFQAIKEQALAAH